MKQRIPYKSIITMLTVALFYTFAICMVKRCDDALGSSLFIKTAANGNAGEIVSEEIVYVDDAAIISINRPMQESLDLDSDDEKVLIDRYSLFDVVATEMLQTTPSSVMTTILTAKPTSAATTEPVTTTEKTTTATTTEATTTEETTTVTTAEETEEETSENIESEIEPSENIWGWTDGADNLPDDSFDNSGNNDNTVTVQPSGGYSQETYTIFDLNSGRYVTDDAFSLITQIVYNEVGSTFEDEAMKAQAVAAYSYIKYHYNNGDIAQLALKPNPPENVIRNVEAVNGVGAYYNGKPIFACFCGATGGSTLSSKTVWGGSIPYLVSVPSEYDYLGANYGVETTFTADEIRQLVESKTNIRLSSQPQNWFAITSYDEGGYVGGVSIDGNSSCIMNSTGKSVKITGRTIRESILGLRSAKFDISYSNGVFTFTTYGYGHGVGMSQTGANMYAKHAGYNYVQILQHYYTGVSVY